jgi:hypothetical protein
MTANYPTWANYMSKKLNVKLINPSIAGTGNHVIATNCIEELEKLTKTHKNSEIQVVVQWTGIHRYDKYVDNTAPYNTGTVLRKENSSLTRIHTGGSRRNPYWSNYYSLQSNEQAFLETLENILFVQFYLKSKSISYKMLCGWDLFTYLDTSSKISAELLNNSNQFTDLNYTNINYNLLKDSTELTKKYWNMIDWEDFWTLNDEKVKFGGMIQWIKKNVDRERWFIRPGDYHPSVYSHYKFADFFIKEVLYV